jgi:hypothetical protein
MLVLCRCFELAGAVVLLELASWLPVFLASLLLS